MWRSELTRHTIVGLGERQSHPLNFSVQIPERCIEKVKINYGMARFFQPQDWADLTRPDINQYLRLTAPSLESPEGLRPRTTGGISCSYAESAMITANPQIHCRGLVANSTVRMVGYRDPLPYGATLVKGGGLAGKDYGNWAQKQGQRTDPWGFFGYADAEFECRVVDALFEVANRYGVALPTIDIPLGYAVLRPQEFADFVKTIWRGKGDGFALDYLDLVGRNGDKPAILLRQCGSASRILDLTNSSFGQLANQIQQFAMLDSNSFSHHFPALARDSQLLEDFCTRVATTTFTEADVDIVHHFYSLLAERNMQVLKLFLNDRYTDPELQTMIKNAIGLSGSKLSYGFAAPKDVEPFGTFTDFEELQIPHIHKTVFSVDAIVRHFGANYLSSLILAFCAKFNDPNLSLRQLGEKHVEFGKRFRKQPETIVKSTRLASRM